MKKFLTIMMATALVCSANANTIKNDVPYEEQIVRIGHASSVADADAVDLATLSLVYTDYVKAEWSNNWFVGGQIGIGSLYGQPKGCTDFFKGARFNYNLYAGKWFMPSFAVRLFYQGSRFRDAIGENQSYWAGHVDLMYNVATLFRSKDDPNPRWNLSPYIGFGLAHGPKVNHAGSCQCSGCTGGGSPFALAYGIQAQYRIAERLHVTAEFGGLTTAASFDGYGSQRDFKESIFSLSAGLCVTIGKVGWERAIDARPYMAQNDVLMARLREMQDAKHAMDNTYGGSTYSGWAKLRGRMLAREQARQDSILAAMADRLASDTVETNVPVYFFFQYGKDKLTDKSQLVNLEKIAKTVQKNGLHVQIKGAADAATGSAKGNRKLSEKRAMYLAKQLKKMGVDVKQMKGSSLGGIRERKRLAENRYAMITIVPVEE